MSDVQPDRPDELDRNAWPDPAAPYGPTRWGSADGGYPTTADTSSAWSSAPVSAGVPPVIAEGPQSRPGWLERGRSSDDGDGAA